MKRIPPVLGSAVFGIVAAATNLAAESRWSVEAGAAQVAVEGIRTYAVPAPKLANQERSRVPAGFVRIAYDFGDAWTVGLSYTRYGQLRASGYSPTSDIFDRGGPATVSIGSLEMSERIQEWSLDGRRRWQLAPRWSVAAGPVVSYFHSSAEFGSSFGIGTIGSPVVTRVYYPIAEYRANDLRLGGAADLKFAVSASWSAVLGYRYAAPPARSLHIGSVGARWNF